MIQEFLLSEDAIFVKKVLKRFATIDLAIVFGSVAKNQASAESDLDIAISAQTPLSVEMKIKLISALAEATGRPIDFVDLKEVGEPLLGQIVQHGQMIIGSPTQKAALLSKHLMDAADFSPYQTRVLAERRNAWINK